MTRHPRRPCGYAAADHTGAAGAFNIAAGGSRSIGGSSRAARRGSEQSSLQQRWGQISCRSAILPNAERILIQREQLELRAVAELRSTIVLGDESFTLVIGDESAKANVNQIIEQFGPQQAEDRIRLALTGTGLINAVRLRPGLGADDPPPPTTQRVGPPQLITGPGQLLDSTAPDRLIETASPVMRELTFWGSGAVNLMRADQTSMRLALAPALTQLEVSPADRRSRQCAENPDQFTLQRWCAPAANTDAIGSMLSTAKIDPGRRNRLALATKSTCHSLWIITNDDRRRQYSLTVLDESNPRQPVTRSLVW